MTENSSASRRGSAAPDPPRSEPSQSRTPQAPSLSSLPRLLIDMGATRAALVACDVTQAAKQFRSALFMAFACAAGACLFTVFSGLAVLIYFWDSHRLAAAIALPCVLATLSLAAWSIASRRMRALPHAMDASLSSFRDDLQTLFGNRNAGK